MGNGESTLGNVLKVLPLSLSLLLYIKVALQQELTFETITQTTANDTINLLSVEIVSIGPFLTFHSH